MSYSKLSKKYLKLREKYQEMISLAGLGCVPSVGKSDLEILREHNARIEKEQNMNTTTVTVEKKTHDHERFCLRNAVYEEKQTKDRELRERYNIDCPKPKTAKDIVVAIQNGKFKYRDEGKHSEDPYWYHEPFNGICFCDPDKEPDHVSYAEAQDKMNEAANDVLLDIEVLEPEKALKSLRTFKEKKYH